MSSYQPLPALLPAVSPLAHLSGSGADCLVSSYQTGGHGRSQAFLVVIA
jgi:hypothetical protein